MDYPIHVYMSSFFQCGFGEGLPDAVQEEQMADQELLKKIHKALLEVHLNTNKHNSFVFCELVFKKIKSNVKIRHLDKLIFTHLDHRLRWSREN